MSGLNKVHLIGRLGQDPEVRYLQDGTPVASFSLATSENWTDKAGERQERTEWHKIVAWNKLADLAKKYLAKGRQVYVEGKIQYRDWTDKEGVKRKSTEIVASNIVFLGSKPEAGDEQSYGGGGGAQDGGSSYGGGGGWPGGSTQGGSGKYDNTPQVNDSITDDDIPFDWDVPQEELCRQKSALSVAWRNLLRSFTVTTKWTTVTWASARIALSGMLRSTTVRITPASVNTNA